MSILHQLQVSGAHYLWLRPGRFETALYSVIAYVTDGVIFAQNGQK